MTEQYIKRSDVIALFDTQKGVTNSLDRLIDHLVIQLMAMDSIVGNKTQLDVDGYSFVCSRILNEDERNKVGALLKELQGRPPIEERYPAREGAQAFKEALTPKCETPRRQSDELYCGRCGMRWDIKEDKPPCPRGYKTEE